MATEGRIRDEIKQRIQYAPRDVNHLVGSVSEDTDFSESDIREVIHEMVKEGTLFKPDQKSIQRT